MGFLISVPVMILTEYKKFPKFWELLWTSPELQVRLAASPSSMPLRTHAHAPAPLAPPHLRTSALAPARARARARAHARMCTWRPSHMHVYMAALAQAGLIASGMAFYLYNELATMTIKKTGAVTASVANTAKRVIVLVFMSAVTGKALTTEQKIGAAVAIAFVMLYSVIDDLVKKFQEKQA